MPGVLNKFFTPRHKGEEEKLPQKIGYFLEKIIFFRFSISTNPQFFFIIKYLNVKFNKVSFGGRNVRAHALKGIRCEKDEIHRHVKKDWPEIRVGKLWQN